MRKLHIDIETYSSVDIKTTGMYKYAESPDFEILIIAYAFDDDPIEAVKLALGETMPRELINAFTDKNILKCAHNAMFERVCLRAIGYDIPIEQIECTMVKSAYCGLPFGLDAVSEALKLDDKAKSAAGKALIKFFSCPVKRTAVNNYSDRNMAYDFPERFEQYVEYCIQDVEAERAIDDILKPYDICKFELDNYILDQQINDRGILVDLELAQAAYDLDIEFTDRMAKRLKEITHLENPNSPKQLISWLNNAENKMQITSIAKETIDKLLLTAEGYVLEVLQLRKMMSKTSVKKYTSILNSRCDDRRIRGVFQFYGANRTGRFAGRLVQLQNLPANKMKGLDGARSIIRLNDFETADMMYSNIPYILSQLVRTAFIAKPNHIFAVSDFSSIEARVLSWLAEEEWRMEVFATHGKIYEASASRMFNVPIELVTKDSDYRVKGKNAELALGYGGSLGAMKRMGGESMGLSDNEMMDIVRKWRKANRCIVNLWSNMNDYAVMAVSEKKLIETEYRGISFESDGFILKINLPSGRHLSYFNPRLKKGKFDSMAVVYKNVDQITKKWWDTDTYGGKIVENIVQAISRDILCNSMLNLNKAGFDINMHVHDEIICEVEKNLGEKKLTEMEDIMKLPIDWAPDLILGAAGYITEYYKKD